MYNGGGFIEKSPNYGTTSKYKAEQSVFFLYLKEVKHSLKR